MRLRTFGGLSIEGPAQELGGAAGQRRPLALLLLLAAAGERGVSRDKMLGLLWPESDEERARGSLRQTLSALRRDLGEQELFLGTTELRLNNAVLPSDIADFDAAVARGGTEGRERVVELYAGPLADGFFLTKAPDFERWLEEERRRRAQQFAEAVEALAREAVREGNHAGAVALWRRLANADRLSSRVALGLMEALAAAGDREAAIKHARVHASIVRAELDTEPDPAVAALAEQLRHEPRSAPAPTTSARRVSEPAPPTRDAMLQEVPSHLPCDVPRKRPGPVDPAPVTAADTEVPLATSSATDGAHADVALIRGLTTRTRALRWPLAAAGLAAVTAAGAILTRPSDAPALDGSLYAVMPFVHTVSDSAEDLLGDDCQLLLGNAFSYWQGVRVVDGMRVKSAYEQFVGSQPDLRRVLDAARSVHAGVAVWGDVRPIADSIYVRAALYDVARGGRTIREYQVGIARDLRDLSDAKRKFRELADSLLLSDAGAPVAADAIGTSSYDAYRAYAEGHRLLGEWDLAGARRWFERATELDPQFPHAYLWLIQTTSFQGMLRGPEWRLAAARAAALRERLGPPDREFAMALLDLAEGHFQDACGRYRSILARDSLDFRAWHGLGECQALDELVVEDRQSPSGWRFRSSQGAAIAAYTRALALTPAAYRAFRGRSFARLSALLYAETGRAKRGHRVIGRDTVWYLAFPTLESDTLAFLPYSIADLRARKRDPIPTSHAAAVVRNRETLRAITERWMRAFPRSPDATEGHARALEAAGELTSGKPSRPAALDLVRRARRLAREPEQQFRLATSEVRLLLRTSDYTGAASLAESLLATASPRDPDGARRTAGLAALLGRVHRAAALLAEAGPATDPPRFPMLPDGTPVPVPAAVLRPAHTLYVYSAFGDPRDSIRALWNRVESAIRMGMPGAEREDARIALLYHPAELAYGSIGPTPLHRRPPPNAFGLLEVQVAAMRGDTSLARPAVDSIVAQRRLNPSHPLRPPAALQYARLMLASRDTARAAAVLDALLDGLPVRHEETFHDPVNVPVLIRAMALRAELAAATRDAARARRWATAVAALWHDADPPLAGLVMRSRDIATQYRRP